MDKLTEIMEWKRKEISSHIRPVKLEDLESSWKPNEFWYLISGCSCRSKNELSIIAEIKRKSPSAGDIAENASAGVEQARTYLNADANALSILTDKKYFGGELKDLWDVNDFINNHQRKYQQSVKILWYIRYK